MKNQVILNGFGTHLRVLREKAKLSQQELADNAELAKITIQRIENAKNDPTLSTLKAIADALKIPLKKLTDF